MLCKVFLDGEIWNTGETRNLFFPSPRPLSLPLFLSLALSLAFALALALALVEKSFYTVERIALRKSVPGIACACDSRHGTY